MTGVDRSVPFPIVEDKRAEETIVTPEQHVEHRVGDTEALSEAVPDAVVLCFQDPLFADTVERYDCSELPGFYPDVYTLDRTDGRVGVVGDFGIGAPVTAMAVEELVAFGVAAVVPVGIAASLDPDLSRSTAILPDRAIRDEGTSHHYLPPSAEVPATAELVAALGRSFEAERIPYREGATWSTDAFYRTTAREVRRYRSEGAVSLEMEAATVFSIASVRGVDAACAFAISDYVTPAEWRKVLSGETYDVLAGILDATVTALVDHVD